jgi:PAS domain S-box-containing protein/putative nucleotidyltransferase with HDIG domain
MSLSQTPEVILAELIGVRKRLAEAEELVRAIRQGEEDALVNGGFEGDEVYPLVRTLQQQLEFQEALLDTIPIPVFYKNFAGEFLGCNYAFADMVGKPKAEIINTKAWDLFPPDLASFYRQKDEELILQGDTQEYETEVEFGDGKRHPVITRKTLFYQPDGSIGGIIGVITDITERRRAETERERLAAIVTSSDDAILGKTLEGVITDWNPAAEQLYGYTAAEILGKSVLELVPPERQIEIEDILKRVSRGTGVEHLPTVRRRKDGTLVEVSLIVSPIKDGGGQIIGASAIARDITEILGKERQLKASEARYRLLVEQIPAVVYKGYDDWSLDFFDNKIEDFTGYSKADFDSRRICWSDLILPEDLPGAKKKLVEALRGDKSFVREYRIRRRDGEIIWVQGRSQIFLDAHGRISHVSGVLFDITARRQSELAAKLNATRLAGLLRISQYPHSSIQDLLDYALQEAVDLTASKLGYIYFYDEATQQFTLNTWSKDVMQECRIMNPQTVYQLEKTGIWGEVVRQARPIVVNDFQAFHPLKRGCPAGHAQLYKFLSIPVFSQSRLVAVVGVANKPTDYDEADSQQLSLMMDVVWKMVDRQKAAEEIEAAAEKWRVTFDAISDGVCLVDGDQKIRQCNQAMADLTGKSFDDILGRFWWESLFGTKPPPEIHPLPGLQSGQRQSLIIRQDNRWLQITADPIKSKHGEVSGAVHIITDVTEHQQTQNKIDDLNILLKAIKEINEALLRVKTEPELFQQTCDLLLRIKHIEFTWIGLLQPESPEIEVVAHAGREEGYLDTLKVTRDDTEYGRGPSGEAIRTRAPAVVEDMATDPRVAPWREEARKRNFRSNVAFPLVHEEEVIGVLKVYSSEPHAFGPDELEFLSQVAGDVVVGVKSLRVEQEMIQALIQLRVVMHQTVKAIGTLAEYRDPYTAGHQRQVTKLACAIATEMGLESDCIEGLKVAGFLHDLGKITIPAEILSRPGKLNHHELTIMRTHAEASFDILKKINFPWPVAEIVRQHHERLDGSGYPQALAREDILLEARILAVADVVEAMGSHRPYRPALGIEAALEEITKNRDILYDPEVVDCCLRLFREKGFQFI